MKTETIYVYLLDEGTDVWRPVAALPLGGQRYRILSDNANYCDENWEFKTGQIVLCELKKLSDGECLVATQRDEEDVKAAELPAGGD